MTDFLLELLSEEIPARMQAGARAELEKRFAAALAEAGIAAKGIATFSTPRRLALIARDLPAETEAVREEAKGPPEGAPDQAIDGFCRKNGVTRDQLELRDVKGRNTWFAVIEKPGRATGAILAEAIPAIVRAFAWPKSMRWGGASTTTESLRWVRPLQGIVALLGGEVVACEVDGIRAGRTTVGHRFHSSGPVSIDSADDYAAKLRAAHVIVDHEERAAIIRAGAAKAAAEAGFALVEDEGLVVENAGLTEWPVPLLGRFDPAFLDVPPEVIQLTTRVNQKYFVCTSSPQGGEGDRSPRARGGGGSPSSETGAEPDAPSDGPADRHLPASGEEGLAPAFVCTANIEAHDGGRAIVEGNQKVLAARLSDAKFFWELDQKKTLEQHAEKLQHIVFHDKLGTLADKVERVAKLARWLCEEGVISSPQGGEGDRSPQASGGGGLPLGGSPAIDSTRPPAPSTTGHAPGGPPPRAGEELADLAEQAARLCKADLVTEMVGEFPELQGLMGGYYAEKEGLDPRVAAAIRDHYKPVGQGDEVPTAPVTVAVSLADKLDTLACFFGVGLRPTGSKDPFALRRSALAALALIEHNKIRVRLGGLIAHGLSRFRLKSIAGIDVTSVPIFRDYGDRNFGLKLDGDTYRLMYGDKPVAEWAKAENASLDRAMVIVGMTGVESDIWDFFADRLKVQQREAGVRHDLIDAVFALGGEDDLVRLLARVKALQSFVETGDGANLLAGYKRAANILKKEGFEQSAPVTPAKAGVSGDQAQPPGMPASAGMTPEGEPVSDNAQKTLSYTPENAEKELIDALDSAEPRAIAAIEAEDFEGAMAALAALRAPIDAFFDSVTVNDPDPDRRAARLALLARFRGAVHKVADFSQIEG